MGGWRKGKEKGKMSVRDRIEVAMRVRGAMAFPQPVITKGLRVTFLSCYSTDQRNKHSLTNPQSGTFK